MRVNIAETEPRLEIFVSMDKKKRDCALITDFPRQLIEALRIELTSLTDLYTILHVPLESIDTFLVEKGIISGTSMSSQSDSAMTHEHNGPAPSPQKLQREGNEENQSYSTSYTRSVPEQRNAAALTILARAQPPTRSLSSHVRGASPIPWLGSHESPNSNTVEQNHGSNPGRNPEDVQPTLAANSSIFSPANRNRNRDRLQNLARGANGAASSQTARAIHVQNSGNVTGFDLRALGVALEDPQRTPPSISLNRSQHGYRPRQIPDRNEQERARDFEIGFLGEQFVRDAIYINARKALIVSGLHTATRHTAAT